MMKKNLSSIQFDAIALISAQEMLETTGGEGNFNDATRIYEQRRQREALQELLDAVGRMPRPQFPRTPIIESDFLIW